MFTNTIYAERNLQKHWGTNSVWSFVIMLTIDLCAPQYRIVDRSMKTFIDVC